MRYYFVSVLALCLCSVSCSGPRTTPAATAKQERRILYYHDPMHPTYRSDRPGIAPDCNMALTPVYADDSTAPARTTEVRVNEDQAAAIGLRTEAARDEVATLEIRTVGRVEAQESRRFLVTAGADGWIRRIYSGETGSKVTRGQSLADYYSRDITTPQQAYLYALDAQQRLGATATAAQKDLAAAQTIQARDYLESLGLTDAQITELARSRREGREVTIGAPASGVVLERKVSEGARFERGDVLWVIADIDAIWITADLFAEDMRSALHAGVVTVILSDGSELRATTDSSLPRFEPSARIGKLRLIADNRSHRLLPGMTVTVTLSSAAPKSLTVPIDAVIEPGIKPRVFVRRSDGSLEPRLVATGWRSGGRQQIVSGLRAGEEVVISGAFLIDSESRLR